MKKEAKELNNYTKDEQTELDEIREESGAESFVKKNRNLLIGIIAIVAIAAIAIVFFVKSSASKSDEASLQLSRILPFIEQEQYSAALEGSKDVKVRGERIMGLKEIVKKYSGTDAGKLAALYAGNCSVNLNKFAEAEEYFETAMNSNSFVVIQGANAGLGKVFELENKYEKAAEHYENAAEYAIEDEVKARFQLYAGICYGKGKNKDKAIDKFKEVVNLSPMSEFSDIAKQELALLGTIID